MRVLVTGGSGLLGEHLINALNSIPHMEHYAPSSLALDVTSLTSCVRAVREYKPDVVVHAAAVAKYRDVEDNISNAIRTNVVGTCNILHACILLENTRLVYISSDHVFDGTSGLYDTNDKINPLTSYAKTKAAGELSVQTYDNSLVIRTSFCPVEFPFDTAYTDKWTSQDYVDKIAPMIIDKAIGSTTGTCNVGHERRSFYELAKERNLDIKSGSVKDIIKTSKVPILIDTSLIVS
jgi:dTDP-4-dehydrorhamnose reductase|tara:strand:+ start:14799 stop:15506 length:708 start_codon:yes stop_codon:yes gene_type:complete